MKEGGTHMFEMFYPWHLRLAQLEPTNPCWRIWSLRSAPWDAAFLRWHHPETCRYPMNFYIIYKDIKIVLVLMVTKLPILHKSQNIYGSIHYLFGFSLVLLPTQKPRKTHNFIWINVFISYNSCQALTNVSYCASHRDKSNKNTSRHLNSSCQNQSLQTYSHGIY